MTSEDHLVEGGMSDETLLKGDGETWGSKLQRTGEEMKRLWEKFTLREKAV